MHISDVYFLDRHSTLNQLQHILWCLADNCNMLIRRSFVDDIDCFLQSEESCLRISRRSHIHQALAEFIRQKGYQATENHRDISR